MSRPEYDVVVVGARVAGAATAMLLARAGHRVLMLDRSDPATDTNSTNCITRGGLVQLDRWGLLDRVLATGAPKMRTAAFHVPGNVIRRPIKERAGIDFMLAPRRYILDDLLAEQAVADGATLRTGVTVTGVVRDRHGRVVGVAAREAGGRQTTIRARLVIGADGVRSRLATYVGAGVTEQHAPTEACFHAYVGGVPWDGYEIHVSDRAVAGVLPTHNGEASVWLIRPRADLAQLTSAGAGREEAWLQALGRSFPELASRVHSGSVASSVRAAVRLPNLVRQAAGPGWALVGDAGYHRDPITGHGITDAFRDAELVAEAADAALQRPAHEAAAMAGYERERNAALTEVFAITRQIASFPTPAEFLGLQVRYAQLLDEEALDFAGRPPTRMVA